MIILILTIPPHFYSFLPSYPRRHVTIPTKLFKLNLFQIYDAPTSNLFFLHLIGWDMP